MEYFIIVIKVIIAISIINVWLFRFGKSSPWRGGNAKNMKEEFALYGLSEWFMKLVGSIKVLLSLLLVASIWFEQVEAIASWGLAIMMAGAITMHLKVRDPMIKSLPAITFLILSLVVAFI